MSYGVDELRVGVSTNKLLTILRENRTKHEANYNKAKAGFRILLIKELEKKLQAAKDGKKVELLFKNSKPESHLGDYDEIIGMLVLSKDLTIQITQSQYKQWVKDEWSWARTWSLSNAAYLSAAI